jgi:hypothetical protein
MFILTIAFGGMISCECLGDMEECEFLWVLLIPVFLVTAPPCPLLVETLAT